MMMSIATEKFHLGLVAGEALRRLQQQLREWAASAAVKRELRHERRQLAAMSDTQLRDLGISRADAELEASRVDIPAARIAHQLESRR
jgi:uncharacterized protein YjiS (DUF1127 family)